MLFEVRRMGSGNGLTLDDYNPVRSTKVGLPSLANKMIVRFRWALVRRSVSSAKEHPSDLEIFEQ